MSSKSPRRVFNLGRNAERDVEDEIAFHLECRVEELVHSGLSEDEARRRAEQEFGDVHGVRTDLVQSTRRRNARHSRIESLHDFAADAAYTSRTIVRSPGFALTVAITLALGLGAAAAMYGVADRILLRGPEHLVAPASLRRVYAHVKTKASGEFTTSGLSYSAYTSLRDYSRSVASAGAYSVNEGRVGRGVDAVPAWIGTATADFFPLLGVRPEHGRFFTAAEDAPPDGARVVVLDHGYWTREFGASDSAMGRTITINAQLFTVIGVAPSGFTGAELRQIDMWIPVSAGQHPRPDWPTTWAAQWLNIVVRLKPHLPEHQVNDDLTSTFRASYGGTESEWKAADVSARSIAFTPQGAERPEASIARWLSAVALLLLLIAGANVANLLIVRAMRRRHEIAVRLALGISRARLARLLILESLAYSAMAAVIAVAIAFAGGTIVRRAFPPSIAWTAPTVNVRVIAVAAALALVTGALIGLAPIAQVLGTDLASSLREAARDSVRSSRMRRLLLAVQTGLSVMLLAGAGLFIRSMSNVQHLDLGIEPDRVLVARIGWPRAQNAGDDAAAARIREASMWRGLRERIAHYPGVDHVALAIGVPFGSGFGVDVRVPGHDTLPTAPGGGPYVTAVGPDYFATTGTRLLRGRGFTASDGFESARVAIVNQTMASLLWRGENPLGKCIIVNNTPCAAIIGVAHDARRFGIDERASMQYYVPFGQESGIGGTALLVRPRGPAREFVQTLRQAILAAVPSANYLNLSVMQDRVDPQIRPWRLGATMFGVFGVLALLVAAIGLYGAIAYNMAQRTREFGIRLAVGSGTGRLMRGVLYDGLRSAALGVAFGIAAALIAAAKIAPLLFRVSPRDPAVFCSVALVLLATAVVASILPAWRAARTDPVLALRSS